MANIIDANQKHELLQALKGSEINPFKFGAFGTYPNGMKIDVAERPDTSSLVTYGSNVIFSLERKGYLINLYVESTINSTGADNTAKQPLLGARLFKEMILRTKNGQKILETITPEYTQYRIDHLNFEIQNGVIAQCENDVVLNNNTLQYLTPVFLSNLDSLEKALPLQFVEPLELVCKVQDDYTSMGLAASPVGFSFKILSQFYIQEKDEPVYLGEEYLNLDRYYEPPKALTTSSTSDYIHFACEDLVSNTVMIIKKPTTQELDFVNSYNLGIPNQQAEDVSALKSLTPWGWKDPPGNNTYGNSSLVHSYAVTSRRDHINGCLNLRDIGTTLKLTVNYDSIPAGYYLYVFHEVWKVWRISEKGIISLQDFSKKKKTPKQFVIDPKGTKIE